MTDRRQFLQAGLLAAGALSLPAMRAGAASAPGARVVSTWDFGVPANQAAWPVLARGGTALDAVETGARWAESELCNPTVGHCGNPDRDGVLTLDASIMDGDGRCGSVAALEDILHPISVARRVMEKTPHVMLVGEGAQQFAVAEGFEKKRLLTPQAEKAWRDWLKTAEYKPEINAERRGQPGNKDNHDTIGMLAIDAQGRLAGACTTSGMAWKMHGRVGDSPIIGAGLYVDNEVGAATASGVGEEMIRNAASFLVVELMRQGRSPMDACREAIDRVVRKRPEASKNLQVCFLALNKHGEVGAFALHRGFVYAVCDAGKRDDLRESGSVYTTTQS
ncbi:MULTISPECIES: N(4)-(beta-N-acetylglucosaminyl)-L-asparaginase [Pseudoxanthomonas]|jgi:N4-(beta-N-acetylglucosaminyl)-L-asparaginase|uniref:N(4)-(beta-N-acetylglucosaminyl)-L-asparaginase n=1 Tax=Pseudoxanthomonas TaxID=83618 RepID=UPI00161D26BC|nr:MULTISPECIES: N(4)-(beta-N-acetylglucosaminyl)-L-asparaginase [Pseudoxanthomonas]MBB3274395.1 N4-(beta-N-acetylglucosaminyl)-L-asparaginase [Pseudoxanthomonas sp. OG2]MBV7474901.1 N(4)-(beta-N-acetylglucosaminyl)-L-asparaginase [Pseudoxanthomonas sp. PXM05]UBB26994.1 N(4)-(beta-N-acetylglucosaminyl)-L-asparaginase [Pseudoxanthomonas japonensis]